MYHPLSLKTIRRIQNEQDSPNLPIETELRMQVTIADGMIQNGLVERGMELKQEAEEQLQLLQRITPEVQTYYLEAFFAHIRSDGYPVDLFAARRDDFLSQIDEING